MFQWSASRAFEQGALRGPLPYADPAGVHLHSLPGNLRAQIAAISVNGDAVGGACAAGSRNACSVLSAAAGMVGEHVPWPWSEPRFSVAFGVVVLKQR